MVDEPAKAGTLAYVRYTNGVPAQMMHDGNGGFIERGFYERYYKGQIQKAGIRKQQSDTTDDGTQRPNKQSKRRDGDGGKTPAEGAT